MRRSTPDGTEMHRFQIARLYVVGIAGEPRA